MCERVFVRVRESGSERAASCVNELNTDINEIVINTRIIDHGLKRKHYVKKRVWEREWGVCVCVCVPGEGGGASLLTRHALKRCPSFSPNMYN